jgi:hypothetical protein
VEGYCSCGAPLLPESRFCHRCGKPVRENLIEPEAPAETWSETAQIIPPPASSQPPVIADINFRNGLAVRVCLLAATLVYLLMSLTSRVSGAPFSLVLPFLMTAVGGAYAVYLYGRRSGQPITVRTGARVGWMTGVFAFVISTVLFTLAMILISGQGGLAELYKQSMSGMGVPSDSVERFQRLLDSPALVVMVLLVGLGFQFMTMSILGSVGGALWAKLFDRN